MLTFCVLASGSTGNCVYVRGAGTSLLVDCGISARQIAQRVRDVGGDPDALQGVVVSHAHNDHVSGAPVLCRRHGLQVFATRGAVRHLPSGVEREFLRELPVGGELRVGGLTVRTVPTPHDSPQSVGLLVGDGESTLAVITDLGVPTPAVLEALRQADAAVLEMNHDEKMLMEGPYPLHLKRRIRGDFGHLSNAQGASLLARAMSPRLKHLVLAHLSQENNTPAKAREAAEAVLRDAPGKVSLTIARPDRAIEPVDVAPAMVKAAARQLRLPFC